MEVLKVVTASNLIVPSGVFVETTQNETVKSDTEKYFKNLLKKSRNGGIVEDVTYKIIQTENELKSAYCNIFSKRNDSDGPLTDKEKKVIGEFRKLNMKMIHLDEKLDAMKKDLETMIKAEVNAMKEELIKVIKSGRQ